MRKAVILGAGGHCRVILSILFAGRWYKDLEIIDLATPKQGEIIMGIPVAPGSDELPHLPDRDDIDVFLAIGDNDMRRQWWCKLTEFGLSMPNLVSPHAVIDDSADLGDSNVICARAFIGPMVKLGKNDLINTGVILEHEARVGNHCHLAPSVTVSGRSRLEDGCFVGAGATILDGISVAGKTIIGAGATLTRSVESPGGVYVGVPALRKENS